MGQLDLTVLVGEEPGLRALEDAEFSALKTRGVFAMLDSVATRLDAHHLDALVIEEGMEEPDRVAAAANAGDKQVGETLLALEDLAARLDADDAVEIAHHHRIRVRPEGTAEDVVGRANVRDPVAQGLVDRFLEGLLPGLDPAHFGPEETHADDVEALALHVCRAHVNDTLHPEARRHCRRRDPVLASPGLGDDALFAEALREDDLTEGIVDLVGAGVEKILALQVNAGPAEFLGPK